MAGFGLDLLEALALASPSTAKEESSGAVADTDADTPRQLENHPVPEITPSGTAWQALLLVQFQIPTTQVVAASPQPAPPLPPKAAVPEQLLSGLSLQLPDDAAGDTCQGGQPYSQGVRNTSEASTGPEPQGGVAFALRIRPTSPVENGAQPHRAESETSRKQGIAHQALAEEKRRPELVSIGEPAGGTGDDKTFGSERGHFRASSVAAPQALAVAPPAPSSTLQVHPRQTGATQQTAETSPVRAPIQVPEAAQSGPVREISVRLLAESGDAATVRLVERSGELHVSVRSPREELAGPLRDNINDLLYKLENSGFKAESWHPDLGRGRAAERPAGEGSGQHPGSRDSHGVADKGESGRHGDGRRAPAWLEEVEARLEGLR